MEPIEPNEDTIEGGLPLYPDSQSYLDTLESTGITEEEAEVQQAPAMDGMILTYLREVSQNIQTNQPYEDAVVIPNRGGTKDRRVPNIPETWMTSQWGTPSMSPVGMPPFGNLLNTRYVLYKIIQSDVTNEPWKDISEEHWAPLTDLELVAINAGSTGSHMKKFYNWMDWIYKDTNKTYADSFVVPPYGSDEWGYFSANVPLQYDGQPWGTIHQQHDWWRWRASHLLNPALSDTYYDSGNNAPTTFYDWGSYDWFDGAVDNPNDLLPPEIIQLAPNYVLTQYDWDEEGRVFRVADMNTRFKLLLHMYGRRYPSMDYQVPIGFHVRLTDAQIDTLANTAQKPVLYTIPETEISWSYDSRRFYMMALKARGTINNPFNTSKHTRK